MTTTPQINFMPEQLSSHATIFHICPKIVVVVVGFEIEWKIAFDLKMPFLAVAQIGNASAAIAFVAWLSRKTFCCVQRLWNLESKKKTFVSAVNPELSSGTQCKTKNWIFPSTFPTAGIPMSLPKNVILCTLIRVAKHLLKYRAKSKFLDRFLSDKAFAKWCTCIFIL